MNTTLTRRTWPGVDLVRFLCALLVIGIHVYPFGNTGSPVLTEANFLTQNWLCRIAVPFFLICSGFFLFRNMDRTPFPGERVHNQEKKLLRLYLCWTVLYFPLILQEIILVHPQGVGAGVLKTLRNLLFVGSYHHLWYLHAALVAIGIVGLLQKKGVSVQKMLPFAALLFLVGLLPQSYFGILMRLRDRVPLVWRAWEIYEQLFATTRNGLFLGFLYVAMGAWFAQEKHHISLKWAFAGFAVSMALMLAEVLAGRHLRWLREMDMYVFQVPSAFFLFALAAQLPLKDHPVWGHLRALGNIAYFIHVWIYKLLAELFGSIGVDITVPGIHFLTTVAVTLLLAELLLRLRKKPRLAWLKLIID